jgi:hypothetical protein
MHVSLFVLRRMKHYLAYGRRSYSIHMPTYFLVNLTRVRVTTLHVTPLYAVIIYYPAW